MSTAVLALLLAGLTLFLIGLRVVKARRTSGRNWRSFKPKLGAGDQRPSDYVTFDLDPDREDDLEEVRRGEFSHLRDLLRCDQEADGFGGYSEMSRLPYGSANFKRALRGAVNAGNNRAILVAQRRETTQRMYDHFEYDLETKSFDAFLMPDDRYVEFSGETRYSANMFRD